MEKQSPPTTGNRWIDNPSNLPPRVDREQVIQHHRTRESIRALPRSILGIALLRTLGMALPSPPQRPGTASPADIAATQRRLTEIREELAREGEAAAIDPEKFARLEVVDRVEELRESAVRSEAQTAFEAHMRASQLRETLKA